LLKERIYEREPSLGSLPKNQAAKNLLIRTAIAIWEDFEPELLVKLAGNMQSRLKAVIEVGGWYIKY